MRFRVTGSFSTFYLLLYCFWLLRWAFCAHFFLLTYLSDRLLFPLSLTVFFLSVLLFCSYSKFLACVQFSIFIRCLSNFNIHTNLMARCSDFIAFISFNLLIWWDDLLECVIHWWNCILCFTVVAKNVFQSRNQIWRKWTLIIWFKCVCVCTGSTPKILMANFETAKRKKSALIKLKCLTY